MSLVSAVPKSTPLRRDVARQSPHPGSKGSASGFWFVMNISRHEIALLSATARRWPMIEESNAGGCISARFVGVTAVGMDSACVAAKGAAAAASGAGRRDEGRQSIARRFGAAHGCSSSWQLRRPRACIRMTKDCVAFKKKSSQRSGPRSGPNILYIQVKLYGTDRMKTRSRKNRTSSTGISQSRSPNAEALGISSPSRLGRRAPCAGDVALATDHDGHCVCDRRHEPRVLAAACCFYRTGSCGSCVLLAAPMTWASRALASATSRRTPSCRHRCTLVSSPARPSWTCSKTPRRRGAQPEALWRRPTAVLGSRSDSDVAPTSTPLAGMRSRLSTA